jgi:two-component system OmpR family response regulator
MEALTEKQKILHVDDEEDTLAVVKIILEKEGYAVESVNRGEEALKYINLDGYSLLILDIMMPDMSGWELFSRIGKIKPDHKVVFLSILDLSAEKIKELKDTGVKDYIKKPFDRNDLVAKVHAAINS